MILRNPPGIRRHAQLAREVGAEWDEVLGSIMLTTPAFGVGPAVEASGRATLYTWSVVHRNDLPPFPSWIPYVAAVVTLDEGPRMMTNVVGCEFEALEIGMPLEASYFATSEDVTIVQFRPASSS